MQQRRHWSVGLSSLLALGALVWCFISPSEARQRPPERMELSERAPAPAAAPQALQTPPKSSAVATPSKAEAPAEENHIGMPSHPLTPAHQRIYRENNLIGDLNGAMDIADIAGLRKLLKKYREGFPEDAHVLQDGYELIANCLERPSAETRATAQRYYDEERASGLRRYIRRHCLEAIPEE